ncbi:MULTISPECIES: hypothetical protein [Asticcacaulis]|uniref:Uncharacterized protein n=1 Tax=Asticcacaulis excentricus TaxID=78587 RepID=A0A3G9GBE7_9CAUL|nr:MULTISPECIES: hypothetical protein [Asticcacaulis]MCA1936844.1 hypothetical protein [Asticcacaulis sp.]BBF81899.1 hypothetical protein EM6_2515 [Asticcacaulis excentricus]
MEPEDFDRLSEGAAAFLGLSLSEDSQAAVSATLRLLHQHAAIIEDAFRVDFVQPESKFRSNILFCRAFDSENRFTLFGMRSKDTEA